MASLKNKKIAILVANLYEELEVWYPYYRFKEEGAETFLVGEEKGREYKGKYGYPAQADLGIKDIKAKDFDAVVIPGGYAPDYLRRIPEVVKFVREMGKNKVVAAICHGGWLLVSADIIRGKKVTTFFAIKDDIQNAGGLYEDKEVIRDRNIITSRKPADLPAFCQTIIEALIEL